MKIGVMLRHFEQKDGGVRIYTRRLLPALFTHGANQEFVLVYQNPALLGTYGEFANVREVCSRLPGAVIWDQFAVPWIAAHHRVDLLFNPKFTAPLLGREFGWERCAREVLALFERLVSHRAPEMQTRLIPVNAPSPSPSHSQVRRPVSNRHSSQIMNH